VVAHGAAAPPRLSWEAAADDEVIASYAVGDTPVEARHRIDQRGRTRSVRIARWGDPRGTGSYSWHPFGGEFHRQFHGLTIPHGGRFGWSSGTADWAEAEFFHYEITTMPPVL
jgi:hypothetical protein